MHPRPAPHGRHNAPAKRIHHTRTGRKYAPDWARPKARARPHPAASQYRTRTSPLSALPHAPPHRTAATTRQPKASTTPAPAESTRQTEPDQKRAPDRTRPQANTAPAHPPCRHCPMLRRTRPPPEPASAPPHPRPRAPLLSTAAPPPDHARLKVPIRLPAAPAPARSGLSALKQVLHTLSTEFSTFSPVSHSGFLSPWLSLRETG